MIGARHLRILRVLYERLNPAGINWVVTGSCSFALQGLPVEPNDIDIQSDEAGVYAIERMFADRVTRPVAFSSKPNIRSHFGALDIDGIRVELIGDIQKREADEPWDEPPDLNRFKRRVEIDGMQIPVLSLEYEAQAYRKMGRFERAEMLRNWLAAHVR